MEFNGTFLVVIISFIVFVYLMNKLMYEPVRSIVLKREELIEGNYSEAETNNQKSKELTDERDTKLVSAREDARVQYIETLNEFKEQKNDIIQQAQNETADELNSAYENLNNVSNDAKNRLKGSITDLANDIVEKVLGYRSEVQGFDNDKIDEILYR